MATLAIGAGLVVFAGQVVAHRHSNWLAWALTFAALLAGIVFACAGLDRRCREAEATIKSLRENAVDLARKVGRGQAVVENTANGVLSIDAEGRITLGNPALERIFGVRESVLVGQKIEDADLHPELARVAYECISSRKTETAEIRLSGWPMRVYSVRAAFIGERSRSGDSAMLVIHDVSEMRRRQMHEREFVGNVSHELRTPITAVRTTAEALLAGAKNDPDVVDRFLSTIITESERLSTLIEDLLEITRRDYGITSSRSARVRVREVLERAIGAVRPQAGVKGIEIEVDVPEELVAYCDENQTVQLVRNLADNAVKYTPDGGRIKVIAREEDSRLVISVKDNGIGIPHGEVDRIFERFYRVDKARSRRMGGTGLGLAIVKDIVDACGGTISVDTQLGQGSIFTIMLPMQASASNER